MAKDKDGVSMWFWFVAIIVTRLPCVGFLISLLFAIFSGNESKKNFFKASLLIDILGMLLIILLALLGLSPVLVDLAKQAVDHLPRFFRGN
jgi:hypothetical protein